jgi:ribose transport system ATP-binding protein
MKKVIVEGRWLSVREGNEYLVKECNFSLYEGELVSFCQSNQGQSTLSEVFFGTNIVYEGKLLYKGRPVGRRNPMSAFLISHDNMLIESMSITDNLLAVNRAHGFRFLYSERKSEYALKRLLETLKLPFDIRTPVHQLRKSERYMLMLVKAVLAEAEIVVMDNITEHCSTQDIEWIFQFINRYKTEGKTFVLLINSDHSLVGRSDRIYIVRDKFIEDMLFGDEYSPATFQLMLYGYRIHLFNQHTSIADGSRIAMTMDFSGLLADRLTLDVHRGEVVGVLDLYGCYGSQIYKAFIENFPCEIDGRVCRNYRSAVKNGLAVIPHALDQLFFLNLSTMDNLIFVKLPSISRWSIVNRRMERYCAREYLPGVMPREGKGNPYLSKIKLLIYRWLLVSPKVMIIDNPQLDMEDELREDFSRVIQEVTRTGCAVVIVSTSPNTCINLCDTIMLARKYGEYQLIKEPMKHGMLPIDVRTNVAP